MLKTIFTGFGPVTLAIVLLALLIHTGLLLPFFCLVMFVLLCWLVGDIINYHRRP
jgi:membrane protein DedA with SNARE-associated domain